MNPAAASDPDPRRRTITVPWGRIACYFLASRIFIFVIGIMSVYVIAKGGPGQTRDALSLFSKWDAHWYLNVAQHGYERTHPGVQSSAFFPLYPLLVHFFTLIFGNPEVAGYFISNTLFLGSCFLLWKLVVRDYQREAVADRAVIFLLFSPVSFFFSTIYSESLFLFLMLAVTYFATEKRWLATGGFGYLASLSRPVGILLVVVMAVEYALQFRERRKLEKVPAFLAALAFTGGGLATYAFYLWWRFGNPLVFMQAQSYYWDRHLTYPWRPFEHFGYPAFYDVWFWAAVVTGLVVLVLGFFMRLRLSHSILCVTYFLLYLSTNHLESIPRFLSVLFPFYITIALVAVRWPRLEPLLLVGTAMLLTLSAVLFVNDYWFT